MLLDPREVEIITIVNRRGGCTVRELASHFDVTEVTIRRDLKKLEKLALLKRTHGGAISLSPAYDVKNLFEQSDDVNDSQSEDALILAPVQNRAAHTLRERTLRNGIPFLAESSPQDGAIYLGPRNYEAAFALGVWCGRTFESETEPDRAAHILDISQSALSNTRERSAGFIDGARSILGERMRVYSVDGDGLYSSAHYGALNALQLHPEVNIIFGINDDSVLAGLQAYADLGRSERDVMAFSVGMEGKTLLDTITAADSPLKACVALFPEVVGRLAIDAIVRLLNGDDIGHEVITPYAILTANSIHGYYARSAQQWQFNWDMLPALLGDTAVTPPNRVRNRKASFVIFYRTHEWYQNLAAAMQARATEMGVSLTVKDLQDDLRYEIRELRRLIGKLAATYVADGETIILDAGSTTTHMTQFLRGHTNLTVITNSLDVFQNLHNRRDLRVIMTGGEYDPDTRTFIGRGAHLFLDEIRADKLFLVAGGISEQFGISSVTLAEAEVRRSMIRAAREVIVLGDHTVIDVESNYRVVGLERIDTVVTDAGILAAQGLNLTQHGIKVMIAGKVDAG